MSVKPSQPADRAASRPNAPEVARKHLVARQAPSAQKWSLLAIPVMVAALMGTSVGAQANTVYAPTPALQNVAAVAAAVGNGDSGDCLAETKPTHGDVGNPGTTETFSTSSIANSPTYNSGLIVSSTGGQGGSGGYGAAGASGGTVLLTNTGVFSTTGAAYGMVGLSIGGYGGNSGGSGGFMPAPHSDTGYGGAGSNSSGTLLTTETSSPGVAAGSIGEGSGQRGGAVAVSVAIVSFVRFILF